MCISWASCGSKTDQRKRCEACASHLFYVIRNPSLPFEGRWSGVQPDRRGENPRDYRHPSVAFGDSAASKRQAQHEGQSQTKELLHRIPSKLFFLSTPRQHGMTTAHTATQASLFGKWIHYTIHRFTTQEYFCIFSHFFVHFLSLTYQFMHIRAFQKPIFV